MPIPRLLLLICCFVLSSDAYAAKKVPPSRAQDRQDVYQALRLVPLPPQACTSLVIGASVDAAEELYNVLLDDIVMRGLKDLSHMMALHTLYQMEALVQTQPFPNALYRLASEWETTDAFVVARTYKPRPEQLRKWLGNPDLSFAFHTWFLFLGSKDAPGPLLRPLGIEVLARSQDEFISRLPDEWDALLTTAGQFGFIHAVTEVPEFSLITTGQDTRQAAFFDNWVRRESAPSFFSETMVDEESPTIAEIHTNFVEPLTFGSFHKLMRDRAFEATGNLSPQHIHFIFKRSRVIDMPKLKRWTAQESFRVTLERMWAKSTVALADEMLSTSFERAIPYLDATRGALRTKSSGFHGPNAEELVSEEFRRGGSAAIYYSMGKFMKMLGPNGSLGNQPLDMGPLDFPEDRWDRFLEHSGLGEYTLMQPWGVKHPVTKEAEKVSVIGGSERVKRLFEAVFKNDVLGRDSKVLEVVSSTVYRSDVFMDAIGIPGYAWEDLFPENASMFNKARERYQLKLEQARTLQDLGAAFRNWMNDVSILKKMKSIFI